MRFFTNALVRALQVLLLAGGAFAFGPAAAAEDPDEAELLKHFASVEVWHYPVAYDVGYNSQDVVVTRELVALPPPAGKLCFIRFDVARAEGDYSYGFKPAGSGAGPRNEKIWGVYVHKRGTVTDQLRSVLKLNAIYFFVGEPKAGAEAAEDICARKQAAAAHAYNAPEWSDLIVRAKLVRGWPPAPAP